MLKGLRLAVSGAILSCVLLAFGQGYEQPPKPLADPLTAPPSAEVETPGNSDWAALIQREGSPSISVLALPEAAVAGQIVKRDSLSPARLWRSPIVELSLIRLRDGKRVSITGLPRPLRASCLSFSPQGHALAFLLLRPDSTDLYRVDLRSGKARRVNRTPLNISLSSGFGWEEAMPYAWLGEDSFAYTAAEPLNQAGPTVGPRVLDSRTKSVEDPSDEIRRYGLSRLKIIRGDQESTMGKPSLYSAISSSPDGRNLLVRAFNGSNRCDILVVDVTGQSKRLLAKGLSPETLPELQRLASYRWIDDEPATLYWYEPGAARSLAAPFRGEPRDLFRSSGSLTRPIVWGDRRIAWVPETVTVAGRRLLRINRLDRTTGKLRELLQLRPGQMTFSPLRAKNRFGRDVLALTDRGRAILTYDSFAKRVSRLNLADGKSDGVPNVDEVVTLVNGDRLQALIRRRSESRSLEYRLTDFSGSNRLMISLRDTAPRVDLLQRTVTYTRADGVPLSGILYLPPTYEASKDGPLPVFMWSYPRRFESAAAIAQFEGGENAQRLAVEFFDWELPFAWVTMGYAVFTPNMPIVPTPGHPNGNDSAIPQLVMNAEAAVEKLVSMGVGDRERFAIGGHSYGGFMTAELLAHTKLFRAGIGMSGDYLRLLDPFKFQDEQRTFWQVPDVYLQMSALTVADRIKTPLLLIHGAVDKGPGTAPQQSQLLYDAVMGTGGTVRYVSLPYEDHGYLARESLLHIYWEMTQWMERYVKPKDGSTVPLTQLNRHLRQIL